MREISKYIRYRIDRILNKGLAYQLILLALFIAIILLFVSIFLSIVFNFTLEDAFWKNLMQFIDTGNIAGVEGHSGIVATFLLVTFFGVCGWGLLIAMINNSLQERVRNFSKGNAFIMEKEHSIILGYGEEVLAVMEEFMNGRAQKIVLLSEKNSDFIKKRISFFKKYNENNVIVREGNPSIIENLRLLNIEKAKSVSIVNNDDAKSLKILLSLKKILEQNKKNKIDICVLVNNRENIEIIESLIEEDTNFNLHIIDKYKILYKLIDQSFMYTGLSNVYEELLDYDGIDMSVEDLNISDKYDCCGLSFKEVGLKYMDNGRILLGIVRSDDKKDPLFIPDINIKIDKNNKLAFLHRNNEQKKEIGITKHLTEKPRYKHKVLLILKYKKEKEILSYINETDIIKVNYRDIDAQEIKYDFILNKIKTEGITKIVLISEDLKTDIKAINILLIIRQVIRNEKYNIPVLSLINSVENRNLIYSDDIKDFIVSGKLIGILMANASSKPDILYILYDLLTKNGNEIVIKPYNHYFKENTEKKFIEIYSFLLERKIIAIGVKKQSNIILNPSSDYNIKNNDEIIAITYETVSN